MSSRETVLGRIRSALAADTTPPPPIPRDYIRVGDRPPGSPPVLELMIDRLVDYKAHVREISPDQLADAIDTALADQRSVVLAPDLDPAIAAAAARSGRTLTTDGTPAVLTPPSSTGSTPSSPPPPSPSRYPAPSPSTAAPAKAAAPSPWSPTSTSSSCTPSRSCTPSPKPSPASTPSDPSP